jgi:hypothetical protein
MAISRSSILDRIIIKDLTNQANRIAEKAKSNASWSQRIPDAISVGKAQKTSSGYEVTIKVDLKEAPHAAAFEYGSGEHGERGEKYRIEPIEKGALAFKWTPERIPWGSPKFIKIGRDDRLLFHFVDHPGVKAMPYLKPAIDESRPGLLAMFAGAIKGAYKRTVTVEVISAKK